jgi:hypothetical protein
MTGAGVVLMSSIESHYEHNYGGALHRLNAVSEELEVSRGDMPFNVQGRQKSGATRYFIVTSKAAAEFDIQD